MSRLETFSADANIAVVGAAGGIGQAFCRLLSAEPKVKRVHALSRTRPAELDQTDKVTWHAIDIEDQASIAAAADSLGDTPLDLVIVTTGILHRGNRLQPERRLAELDQTRLTEVIAVNAIGPAMVARYFIPKLRRSGKSVFAVLSARVGSIADNRLGGWASYRASKAALNQLIRTIAIEQARTLPDSIVVSLHPGTVDTALSTPYTSRTPAARLFSPLQAADYLLNVIDGLTPQQTGGFFAWDGSPVEY